MTPPLFRLRLGCRFHLEILGCRRNKGGEKVMLERRRFWWGSLLRPKDARGRESRTLAFIGSSWVLVSLKFSADAFLPIFGVGPFQPLVTVTEYATVTAALLAVWLGRERIDAKRGGTPDA